MTLLFIVLGITVAGYLYYALRNREIATKAAFTYCKRAEVMLLDQNVVFWKLRIERQTAGRMQLNIYYRFEFTVTGERRLNGTIKMLGNRVAHIELQPYPIEKDPSHNDPQNTDV